MVKMEPLPFWYSRRISVFLAFSKAFVISAIASKPAIVSSVPMKMMQLIAASVLSEETSAAKKKNCK